MALLIVALCTALAKLMHEHFEQSTIVMTYMLSVVLVAMRYGRGPSILASFMSVALFDFIFVPPNFTFAVADAQYLITFVVMLVVALIISSLMVEVRQQAEDAKNKEKRADALYQLSRELGSAIEVADLIAIGIKHVSEISESNCSIYLCSNSFESLDNCDDEIAIWVFRNNVPAGLNNKHFPESKALYLPLLASTRTIGVLSIRPDKENDVVQKTLLETFANQIAIACERAYLLQEKEKTQLVIKTEQLRSSLLSSVSHDLRTPLATITGAATSIIEGSKSITIEDCRILATEIYNESVRLNTLVKNLLDMTRLQSGNLRVKKEWYPIEEIIGSAIAAISGTYHKRKNQIKTLLQDNLPLVSVDAILIQQVLFNLLDNAMKFSPDGSIIDIQTHSTTDSITVLVIDSGPGVETKNREKIFNKFFQVQENQDQQSQTGSGLGLAIASGIIEAHGGKIWVEERKGGGSVFKFSLPLHDRSGDLPGLPKLE